MDTKTHVLLYHSADIQPMDEEIYGKHFGLKYDSAIVETDRFKR